MNWRHLLIFCALLVVRGFPAQAGSSGASYEILSFAAEEAQIHTREFKKVEVSAEITVPAGSAPPALSLVQVSEGGEKLRFLGILVFSAKKGRWIRKVELLEREPGKLYFEIVPDSELEPFIRKQRPRAVIEVFKRPSLIEIIKGILPKFGQGYFRGLWGFPWTRALASEVSPCPAEPAVPISLWKALNQNQAVGFASPRIRAGKEAGSIAGVQVVIPKPAASILELLWEPANLKNLSKTSLKVESVSASIKKVKVEAKPIFFVTVIWDEEWEKRPDRIVYRKASGDDRLRHFCGWMEVVPLDSGTSRVTLYEEVDAPGRDPGDVLSGHLGTVKRVLQSN